MPCGAMPASSRPTPRFVGATMSLAVAIRNPLRRTFCTRKCLRRSTSCQQRQKVPKERRQNPWFRNPFRG